MENQRTYNLRGLLLVFWGMLLEFLICGLWERGFHQGIWPQ